MKSLQIAAKSGMKTMRPLQIPTNIAMKSMKPMQIASKQHEDHEILANTSKGEGAEHENLTTAAQTSMKSMKALANGSKSEYEEHKKY